LFWREAIDGASRRNGNERKEEKEREMIFCRQYLLLTFTEGAGGGAAVATHNNMQYI